MSDVITFPAWLVCLTTFAVTLAYCRHRQAKRLQRWRMELIRQEWTVDTAPEGAER